MPLDKNLSTDVVVVGGGIAGAVTAYFILRDTNKKVLLLEADKVAHGATGHNAGQITSYFERPFADIAEEFGVELAAEGQKAIESAWDLLDEIYGEARLQTPKHRFMGHTGYTTIEQVLLNLKNNAYRRRGGLHAEHILIAEDSGAAKEIPHEYKELYTFVPRKDLLALLETNNQNYIASASYEKGCMNSALFTEELLVSVNPLLKL